MKEETTKTYYSLLELTSSIESVIKKTYSKSYWVKAEIAKLNYYPKSGHCYPDLVEKENGVVLAQIRATIWAGHYNDINAKFLKITKEPISDGMTVLIRTSVNFHPVYGMGLQIIDIEPSFTLGELAKERLLSIERLKTEGIFNNNKKLLPAIIMQRVAVISVETSKGYHDFVNIIENNDWGYSIFHMLFPALLQGKGAVISIKEQLAKIKKAQRFFDAVVIIRGGGGDIGLSSYDNFELAKTVALFPIPIITGIGHATNETVVELVSFANKITPTDVAYYLIQRFHNFALRIQDSQNKIVDSVRNIVSIEKQNIRSLVSELKSNMVTHLNTNGVHLSEYQNRLTRNISAFYDKEGSKLQILEFGLKTYPDNILKVVGMQISSLTEKVKLLDPKNILKRGYTITKFKGKAVDSSNEPIPGDEIETITYNSTIISNVKKVDKR